MTALPPERADRFSRFQLVSWWEQRRLREARVLVVGAGALGNEIIKNLALLGIGSMVVVDLDTVELSNLPRSPLFRERDCGQPKAEVACKAARDIWPGLRAAPLTADVTHEVGLGLFRWADLVVGGLDNREARVTISRCCSWLGRPWVDGGLDVLAGVVRVFVPGDGPCYECTLSEQDRRLLAQRRACSLLPREARPREGHVPTTPTTAAIVAGIQCAEVVKLLHEMDGLAGAGYHFDGVGYDSYRIAYRRDPDCPGHDPLPEVEVLDARCAETTVGDVIQELERRLGPGVTAEACRELVGGLDCVACGARTPRTAALDALAAEDALCSRCGQPAAPVLYHRLDEAPGAPGVTLAELGLPRWDIVCGRTDGRGLALELGGDRAGVLGRYFEER